MAKIRMYGVDKHQGRAENAPAVPLGGSVRRTAVGAEGHSHYAIHMQPARASHGPGRGQNDAQMLGTAATRSLSCARAVHCAAAAPDGQSWGCHRALSGTRAGTGLMLASRVSPAGIRGSVLPRAPGVACRDRSCVRQLRACPQMLAGACCCPLCCLDISSAATRSGLPRTDARVRAAPTTLSVAEPHSGCLNWSLPRAPAIGMLPPSPDCIDRQHGARRRAGARVHPRQRYHGDPATRGR